jgi:glycosyltransferase involved in cell wall biosynthesis
MTAESAPRRATHSAPHCVALSTPDWPRGASPNGIVTHTAEMADALRERGVRPVILTWHVDSSRMQTPVANDADVLDISQFYIPPKRTLVSRAIDKASRLLGTDTLLRARLRMIERAARVAVDRFPIELIEIEEALGLALPVIEMNRVPVVVRLHGPWFLNGRALGAKEDAAFERRDQLEREVIARADAVTAPSRDVLEQTRAHYGLPLVHGEVVPPPIDCSTRGTPWKLADCDRDRILFVGRFDRHKGGDVMIDAFTLLAKERPRLTLDFVGPDRGLLDPSGTLVPLDAYLAAHVGDGDIRRRIIIHGQQQPDAIDAFRRRALVTVAPSRYETFGYTAVEALSLGCPTVAANAGGLAEIVRDRETGLLCEAGDARLLADQIARLLDAPDWAAGLGEAARSDVARRYAPRSIAEQTLATYAAVVERRPGRATRESPGAGARANA